MIHRIPTRGISVNLAGVEAIITDIKTIYVFGDGLSYSLIDDATPSEATAIVDSFVAFHDPHPNALGSPHPVFRHPIRHIALDIRRIEAVIPQANLVHVIFRSGRKTALPQDKEFDLAYALGDALDSLLD